MQSTISWVMLVTGSAMLSPILKCLPCSLINHFFVSRFPFSLCTKSCSFCCTLLVFCQFTYFIPCTKYHIIERAVLSAVIERLHIHTNILEIAATNFCCTMKDNDDNNKLLSRSLSVLLGQFFFILAEGHVRASAVDLVVHSALNLLLEGCSSEWTAFYSIQSPALFFLPYSEKKKGRDTGESETRRFNKWLGRQAMRSTRKLVKGTVFDWHHTGRKLQRTSFTDTSKFVFGLMFPPLSQGLWEAILDPPPPPPFEAIQVSHLWS